MAAFGATSFFGALLFSALGVPVAWLLGAMLSSMALTMVLSPPKFGRPQGMMLAQLIIGMIMGARFSLEALQTGLVYAPALIALLVFTGALCMLNGHLLQKLAGVDYQTSFLGSLPGAASAVVAMSSGLKADQLMVTVLTYVRVLLITILIPLIMSLVFVDPVTDASLLGAESDSGASIPFVGLTALVGLAGALIARRTPIPSPNFLGPFLLVMLLKIIFPELPLGLPAPSLNLGLLLLGCSVGMGFELTRLRHYWKPALVQVGLIIGLLAACLAAGYGFHLVTGVDMLTAILGTTPGGMQSMVALSISMGGNSELVLTMQTLRWLLILFLGPWMATWVARRKVLRDNEKSPENIIKQAGDK